jgi:hypothetical protein
MTFYVDTSAWGGYYHKEFSEWTIPFEQEARQDAAKLLKLERP